MYPGSVSGAHEHWARLPNIRDGGQQFGHGERARAEVAGKLSICRYQCGTDYGSTARWINFLEVRVSDAGVVLAGLLLVDEFIRGFTY